MRHQALKQDNRELILDATEVLLEQYGYRRMTIEDVAQEAGIGKGTVYLSFASKEDLALAVMDRKHQRLEQRLLDVVRLSGEPQQRIQQLLMERMLFRYDWMRRYHCGIDDAFRSLLPAIMNKRTQLLEKEAQILAEVLQEGMSQQVFAGDDALQTARILLLMTNGLVPFNLSPRDMEDRTEVEEKVRQIAELALHGLLRREPDFRSSCDISPTRA